MPSAPSEKSPGSAAPRNAATSIAAAARLVRRARLPRRRDAGDAPAPGIGRLPVAARLGIGQSVARRNVHHDERRQHHLQPARLQIRDRAHAPKGRSGCRHRPARPSTWLTASAVAARQPATPATSRRASTLSASSTFGRMRAVPGAQIVAEPGDDQRHPFEVRAERLQLVDRDRPVGDVAPRMRVLARASRPRRRSASPTAVS